MKKVKKLLKKLFSTNTTSPKTLFLLVTRNSDSKHYTITTTSENSNELYKKMDLSKDQIVVTIPEYVQLQKSTYKIIRKEVGND